MTEGSSEKSRARESTFFEESAGEEEFHRSFAKVAAARMKEYTETFVHPQNVQHFQHGGSWRTPANEDATNTGMQKHSAELVTSYDDLISGDLGLIERSLESIMKSLSLQFASMMYSTIGEAADSVGNTVNSKGLGLAEGFLAMMEKVQFSADKHGKVSLPEWHGTKSQCQKLVAALESQPPEFQERWEALKRAKTEAAIKREEERKAKFVRYGE